MRPAIFDILNWVLASRLWHLGTDCPCRPRALTRRPGPSPGQGTRPTKGNRFPASSPRFRKTSAHPPPGWHCRRAAFAAQLRRSDLSAVKSSVKIQSPGGVTYSAHGLAPLGRRPPTRARHERGWLSPANHRAQGLSSSSSFSFSSSKAFFRAVQGYERIRKDKKAFHGLRKKGGTVPLQPFLGFWFLSLCGRSPLDLKPPKVYERIR